MNGILQGCQILCKCMEMYLEVVFLKYSEKLGGF